MDLSIEFWVQITIQIIALSFVAGGIIQRIKYLSRQIDKLEKKQDKHNNLISRMAVVENDITEVKGNIEEIKGR